MSYILPCFDWWSSKNLCVIQKPTHFLTPAGCYYPSSNIHTPWFCFVSNGVHLSPLGNYIFFNSLLWRCWSYRCARYLFYLNKLEVICWFGCFCLPLYQHCGGGISCPDFQLWISAERTCGIKAGLYITFINLWPLHL